MTMPPRESDPLLPHEATVPAISNMDSYKEIEKGKMATVMSSPVVAFSGLLLSISLILFLTTIAFDRHPSSLPIAPARSHHTGPYVLFQDQTPTSFLDHWEFYVGEDSVGSAGYQVYVDDKTASRRDLITTSTDDDGASFITIRSAPNKTEPRLSIRLEGTHVFDAGLFIASIDHVPTGCGVWPALWLTDEANWPVNGEIDFVESVNRQTQAATALHTSNQCSMYAQVPASSMTGTWDRATGIPDTFTGVMDTTTNLPSDNCWTQAPHQWANQGCVVRADPKDDTMGEMWNEGGGGVYALEWDPAYQRIRSWAFPAGHFPSNLESLLMDNVVAPETDSWGLPYARFAVGEGTGCSADHFHNMRLVLNTAFCGTVAGNRFARDGCVANASDPIEACNAYIASQPDAIEDEAYWRIKGLKVYQRT